MSNSILTPSIIAKEALMQLKNNLVMGRKVHRDYSKEFVKVGDTISIRRPVKFAVTNGATLVKQDVVEGKTTVTMDKRKHVAWGFDTQTLTLSISEYSERYIKPAMISLANQMDYDLCGLYSKVWNWAGTPGQVINSFADFAEGPKRLDLGAVPQDMRNAVLSPSDHWGLLGNQTGLYVQRVAEDAYRRGDLGDIGGVGTAMDQNVNTHTVGAYGGTPRIKGASQEVTYAASKDTNTQSLITDGWSSGATTLKAGDVFTIADVYAVNPRSGATLPHLQQFVVQSDISDTTGDITMTIAPAIIVGGAYATVNSSPANDALITMVGTASTGYTQNMVFHKNAFALVMRPLELPDGAAWKARESYDGLSLRIIKDYDITNDEEICRIDAFYGVKAIYPDLATRLSGT